MSAIVSANGVNIGSAYQVVGGDFAWSVVVASGAGIELRRGRHPHERSAQQAMLAGACEIMPTAVLEVL